MAEAEGAIRTEWLLAPDVAHLNHGSFGAVPRRVRLAQDRLRQELDGNPMRFFRRELPGRLDSARRACADFVGADADSLVFVPNVMAGVSTVLASVPLQAGDEVVVTEHAYGAVVLAVETACRRSGAAVRVARFGLDDEDCERMRAVENAVTEQTRLVVLEQITSPTALALPAARLVERLRARGVAVLVDGAHAVAAVQLSVTGLDADYWVGSLHKWLCAPPGAAVLVVAERHLDQVSPLVTTWHAHDVYPGSFASPGTADPTPYLTAPVAVDLFAEWGWDQVREHNRQLAAQGARWVAEAFGTVHCQPRSPSGCMQLVSLPGQPRLGVQAGKALQDRIAEELRIELSVVSWRGQGWVRLSAHLYNTLRDFERLANAADRIARWGRMAAITDPDRPAQPVLGTSSDKSFRNA